MPDAVLYIFLFPSRCSMIFLLCELKFGVGFTIQMSFKYLGQVFSSFETRFSSPQAFLFSSTFTLELKYWVWGAC